MSACTGYRSDGKLLECFARRHDEEAFAELVSRHGPMVLGVCRQLLHHEHDAEDTFQATFLVLARKAGAIRSPEALPNWLYEVASRLAARTRAASARRQAREVPFVDDQTNAASESPETRELAPVLHEEIARLPEKYRIPFILCYLEGKTNEEAADQLGCPAGTIFSRLARARERLRARLTRRGLATTTGALAALLVQQGRAAVPDSLSMSTVSLALQFDGANIEGLAQIPHRVDELARWGLKSFPSKGLRMIVAACMLLALIGSLGWVFLGRPWSEKPIRERLQGTWRCESVSMDGVAFRLAEAPELESKLIIEGDRLSMTGIGSGTKGNFQIDQDTKPMRIDWTVGDNTIHGIFELRDDTLTLCVGQSPAGRSIQEPPADLTPGPGKSVMVYRRKGAKVERHENGKGNS